MSWASDTWQRNRPQGGTFREAGDWVQGNPEIAGAGAVLASGGMGGMSGMAGMLPMATTMGGALSANRDEREGIRRNMDRARTGDRRWTEFGDKSPLQQRLERGSIDSYDAMGDMNRRFTEGGIGYRGGLERQAGGYYGDVLAGRGFGPSSNEMSRANAMRDLEVDYESRQVNDMLNERLGDIDADAARRGLRGQAVQSGRTQATTDAARMFQDRISQASMRAGNRADNYADQRLGYQQQAAGQMQNYQQQLVNQAMQNRMALQNPVMLQNLRAERQAEGVNVAPLQAYNSLIMKDAGLHSDLTAGLMGFNNLMGQGAGALMGGGFTGGIPGGVPNSPAVA